MTEYGPLERRPEVERFDALKVGDKVTLKVGDQVEITYTQALAISVTSPGK